MIDDKGGRTAATADEYRDKDYYSHDDVDDDQSSDDYANDVNGIKY